MLKIKLYKTKIENLKTELTVMVAISVINWNQTGKMLNLTDYLYVDYIYRVLRTHVDYLYFKYKMIYLLS